MANRLNLATSPYLQQHANNPVHWWEWSDAAFAQAKRRDLPIFLSIGYSACHWCHVMAHESFEDKTVADFLNAHFISIKVDREERPDLDSIYMQATVALTGRGGWPMTVFLDHDGRPFYAGTYFPPTPHHGLPSFMQLLHGIHAAWAERRTEIYSTAIQITHSLETPALQSGALPSLKDLEKAVSVLERDFDAINGGFGSAPKFPPSMVLEFLLREHARSSNTQALDMAEKTLTSMARGGLYDQLGGGFARYCVDSTWVVPHFEKMLYDNALLLRVYVHWWRLTGSELAERVVYETVEFLLRELRTDEGGFASALDADSEGAEGTYYLWSLDKLNEVLSASDALWVSELCQVNEVGTFENDLSTLQLLDEPVDQKRWMEIKDQLFTARADRPRPNRDDKIVAAWNGLTIAALVDAGMLFNQPLWIEAAESAAELIVNVHLDSSHNRLLRTSRDGMAGTSWGVLDDYADVAEGFLCLYQATGVEKWITLAGKFLDVIILHFDDGAGGFFDTADDAPALIRRPKTLFDNAEPSGWLAAAHSMLTYSALTGSHEYRLRAESTVATITSFIPHSPRGIGWGLVSATALLDGPVQIAIVGGDDEATEKLWQLAWRATSPGAVVARTTPDSHSEIGLLENRPMQNDEPTAYICRGFVCERPINDPDVLAQQLGIKPLPFHHRGHRI